MTSPARFTARTAFWVVAGSVLAAPASGQVTPDTGAPAEGVPARLLPVVAEHRYMVTASIRPLYLFWISRDNVGTATLRWRADAGGRRGYELLIGSDPERAPRRINRWGYIAEEVGPASATLLGVMKDSDEKTLEEAEKRVSADGGAAQYLYKAIRTDVAGAEGRTATARLVLPRDPTYRDVDSVLAQLPRPFPGARAYPLPAGVRSGYLPTLQALIDETIAWYGRGQPAGQSPVGRVVRYIYNGTLYELALRSAKPLASARYRGRNFSNLVHAELVITNTTTGEKTRFEVQSARTGPLAGIPVHASFRTRWWFEVEMVLDDLPPVPLAPMPFGNC